MKVECSLEFIYELNLCQDLRIDLIDMLIHMVIVRIVLLVR